MISGRVCSNMIPDPNVTQQRVPTIGIESRGQTNTGSRLCYKMKNSHKCITLKTWNKSPALYFRVSFATRVIILVVVT
jgi:hypothetical protein